jgi:hypothetical protein
MLIAMLALAATTPTVMPSLPKTVIVAPARPSAPDMAMMLKMFDTFFPPQPEPDPLRLPMAQTTALVLLPPNSLGVAARDMMGGLFERVMAMRGSDFPGAKPLDKGVDPNLTLRQALVAKDPFFLERERLTRAAVEAEFMRYSAILEPRLRDGIARAVARRFDQRQLAEINAFFATDTGRALGRQFLGLWFDPDLMRSSISTMPDLIKLMPGSIERIQAATAHLPPPPKAPPKPPERSAPRAKTTRG